MSSLPKYLDCVDAVAKKRATELEKEGTVRLPVIASEVMPQDTLMLVKDKDCYVVMKNVGKDGNDAKTHTS